MAQNPPRLKTLERQWLINHITGTTITPQMPLGQLRRVYYTQFLSPITTNAGLDDLEQNFLRKWIRNQGGTPLQTNFNSPLWKQAVVQLGIAPSKWQTTNQLLFFLNAP